MLSKFTAKTIQQYRKLATSLLFGSAAMLIVPHAATANDYPTQPVKIIVGYPAGGSGDIAGRIMADALSNELGTTVIVENVSGAGGSIGAQRVVSSEPDGHTLLVGANNEIAINNLTNPNLNYNGLEDLAHIGLVTSQPLVLVANPATNIKNLDDFVSKLQAEPERYSYGTSGVGTVFHLVGEHIQQSGGVSMLHVPYRGAAPLMADLMGGQIDLGIVVLSSALPAIKDGRLIAIGTTEKERADSTPDIPALAENPQFKDVDIGNWYVMAAPKDTPSNVIERLRAALQASLASEKVQERIRNTGSKPATGLEDIRAFLDSEAETYKEIVKMANIQL